MKKLILIFIVLVSSIINAQKPNQKQNFPHKMEKIFGKASLGQLICIDEYGYYAICTGDEFEKILGFCTNAPYITVNKAKGNNKITEHNGIASFAKGKIEEGDYLCPCEENPGQVVKCKKTDYPYAKAMESPTEESTLFKVKILGHRRKH